ncbi:MAG: hypothetical protein AAFN92_06775, partial [Bacteroidota bacterium]
QMKTLIISCLCLTYFVSVPAIPAELPEEPMIVRSKTVDDGLELRLANLEQTTTKVQLTSLDREREVFTEHVRKHNGYALLIKNKDLKHGRYLLTVSKGKTTRKQVILVTKAGMMASDWK